jgi:large subunit ribosomal protein L31
MRGRAGSLKEVLRAEGAVPVRSRVSVDARDASEALSKGVRVKAIHPELVMTSVRCASCGTEFTTRSSRTELVLDVCSSCHPAYTGVERDSVRGTRIERFERRRARAAAA